VEYIYRHAVDPEIKKKLDQTIQEARQALEVINEDANNLAAEEREIRAEEALFKKTFVCHFCAGRKVNVTYCVCRTHSMHERRLLMTGRSIWLHSRLKSVHIVTFQPFSYLTAPETNKNKLKDLENAPSVEDERAKLKKKLFEISKKRVRIVKEYTVSFLSRMREQN
jgi:hypothetical protein